VDAGGADFCGGCVVGVAVGSTVGAADALGAVLGLLVVAGGGAAVTVGAPRGLGRALGAAELVDVGALVGALLGASGVVSTAVTVGAVGALVVLEVALGAVGAGAGELVAVVPVVAGAGLFCGARRARPTRIAAKRSPTAPAIHPRRRDGSRRLLAGSVVAAGPGPCAGWIMGPPVGVGVVSASSSASLGGGGPDPPFRMLGCVTWRRVPASAAVFGFAAAVPARASGLSRTLPVGMRGSGPAAGTAPST
jgi:hypothetical protein